MTKPKIHLRFHQNTKIAEAVCGRQNVPTIHEQNVHDQQSQTSLKQYCTNCLKALFIV